ncbi:MAG TPA: hypothetical protein VFG23_04165 [Polyangia bacterium]|nr:hypothetical protein [Polyangia bacterium]
MSLLGGGQRQRWWVDPNGSWSLRRHGRACGKTLGMGGVRGGEDAGARGEALIGETVDEVKVACRKKRGHRR